MRRALSAAGRIEGIAVPKMKTHSGAKKRFKLTSKGRVKRSHSLHNHILTKKSPKRKRHLRKAALVSPAMEKVVRRLLAS